MAASRRAVLQAAAALALSACAPRARPGAAAGAARRAAGYLAWWMAPGWRAMGLERFARLVLFDAPILPDGRLEQRDWPAMAPGLIEHARAHGTPLELALTLFDEGGFARLFGNPAALERLLGECRQSLETPWLAGLHLDIEGYEAASAPALAAFRAWLAALEASARALGKTLSAFYPASDSFAAYDAAAAARIAWWVAQLYDAHWAGSGETGPLVTRRADNPVAVPRALARLAALGIRRASVLLSVPLYGWQWPSVSDQPGARALGRARLLTFAATPASLMPEDRLAARELAARYGLRRDAEHTPYYAYRDDSRWLQGWYEDLDSLTRKLAPERSRGYGGLAFFPLGYDGDRIVAPLLRWWEARS